MRGNGQDMPMKKNRTVHLRQRSAGPLPALPDGLLDDLLKGPIR